MSRKFFGLLSDKSVLGQSAQVLSKSEKKKIVLVIFFMIFMGLLDLIGVAFFGILGALTVSGIQLNTPGHRVQTILDLLNLTNLSVQNQTAILALIATSFLVAKTILSIFFTRKILFFLSRRTAVVSAHLTTRLFSQPLTFIQSKTSQETVFMLTHGVGAITIGILGTLVTLCSDVFLLVIMSIGLVLVDPVLSLVSFAFFSIIGLILYFSMHKKAEDFGFRITELSILSSEKILEVIKNYRETVVRNRRFFYANYFANLQLRLSHMQAEVAFLPYVNKYIIETAMVLGALILAGVQFFIQDMTTAIATLTVFLLAGSRVAPAILRVQQAMLQIKNSSGAAKLTLNLIAKLGIESSIVRPRGPEIFSYKNFVPEIQIKDISFAYEDRNNFVLDNISLNIKAGSTVAIVGPSGSGKTTLVDLILGVITPNTGAISISGKDPLASIDEWPGAIAYVPQDVQIIKGTIRENIALGFPPELATINSISNALAIANLSEFVENLEKGIDQSIGENGLNLSGGQKQRLGIARAFFTQPQLIVMDEATSALDSESESLVSEEISKFKGKVTLILIAHRLSTVRYADHIIYLENGKIRAQGTFEHLAKIIPNFGNNSIII